MMITIKNESTAARLYLFDASAVDHSKQKGYIINKILIYNSSNHTVSYSL